MESQDGISVRPMRLKVLYTFDDENKTNCLARWPHLLEIQTAHLDEETQIGVIELKTCIQAIVSASPELVAKLGQDYTVYAYDYSEYETPLVGQGMLSWVLASASPTPNAPAHQSKTMVTGRVCKNVLGLFSKGAQETLEVRLRLIPVPTVLQSEYLDSMQRYRELSNVIPHEFDAQAWTNFLRQNPSLMACTKTQQPDRTVSPMDHSGIEKFHQLLSEGSTPREWPSMHANEPFRSVSPTQSALAPSRVSTPGGQRPIHQLQQRPSRAQSDVIRPSSSASMREVDFHAHSRRGSLQSGYGSGDETAETQQPRKRAKLYRADWPGKSDYNIERQPSSLRVAASTAASVRIHRPTPVNPAIAAAQRSNEEPVRPPTPISRSNDIARRARPPPSLLRESSNHSNVQYTSPYPMSDDQPSATSPEESRYQGLFEPSFSMPSSPPVMDCGFPTRSSPVLPPLPRDHDSGFMSGGLEDIFDDIGTPLEECARVMSNEPTKEKRNVRPAVDVDSPHDAPSVSGNRHESFLASDAMAEPPAREPAPALPPPPASATGSRPSSRASVRHAPKPLAPAPLSQSEVEQLMNAIPASDPIMPPNTLQHSHSWAGPMSDFSTVGTPAPQPAEEAKVRSGAGARRLRQVQARLDQCIKNGQVPPYCENCGAIETPTWRRAWSKEMVGSEQDANEFAKDSTILFWQSLEKDEQDKVTKFKVYKKTLDDSDNDFVQILLCNPCGLWLHKFKTMRPENRWNKHPKDNNKKKRSSRNRKGPLSNTSTRSRSKAQSNKPAESSPGPTEASSPVAEDGITPRVDNDNDHDHDDDIQEPPSKRRRANSVEPRRSTDTAQSRWQEDDAMEALRRAIQSSPARNMKTRTVPAAQADITPKPVRRALFPTSQNDGPLKTLGESLLNSPRRSPRTASRESGKQRQDKENHAPIAHDGLDSLFESPNFEFEAPASPTPRRGNPRAGLLGDKRLSLPCNSPTAGKRKVGLDVSPSRITAEKLQCIQGIMGFSPRQVKASRQSRDQVPGLPELSENNMGAEDFEGIDPMIMDIFEDDAASTAHTDPLYPFESSKCPSGGNWAGWMPSDYVSPMGSDEDHGGEQSRSQSRVEDDPEDLISAILADPDIQKANLLNSQFGPFSSVLDSGFFSSDQVDPDMIETDKQKSPAKGSRDTEHISPPTH